MSNEVGAFMVHPNLVLKAGSGGRVTWDSSSFLTNLPLKTHAGFASSEFTFQTVSLATTDATVTTIFSRAVPLSTTVGAWAWVIGKKVGANADGLIMTSFNACTNNAGTVAVVGTTGGGAVVENSVGSPIVTIVADDTNDLILVRITGVAAESWAWTGLILSGQVTSSS